MRKLSDRIQWAIRNIEEHGMVLHADTLRTWLPMAERVEAESGAYEIARTIIEDPEDLLWITPDGHIVSRFLDLMPIFGQQMCKVEHDAGTQIYQMDRLIKVHLDGPVMEAA